MGIKDNFSQAVKELWKNDRQEEQPAAQSTAAPAAQQSGLDSYLRQPEEASAPDTNTIPLEPPAQPAAQEAQPAQPAQPVQQPQATQSAAQPAPQSAPAAPNQATAFGGNVQQAPANGYNPNNGFGGQAPTNGYNPNGGFGGQAPTNGYNPNNGFGGGFVPPASGDGNGAQSSDMTDEVTVISKNTVIDGNLRSLANMQIDGNIKGNIETTRNIDMTGKVVGDITCNNASFASAAMQGNVALKGRMRMDRDTILIGDLSSSYADINGRIRGKLDIAGKAELKRDAIIFGDINASTIAVTDGAIIQGYVNTTFLSKEDGRNAIPDNISFESKD